MDSDSRRSVAALGHRDRREEQPETDGDWWANRSAFWLEQCEPKRRLRRREREAAPLILTGHGLSVRVDKGCLLIRDGNTHYPSKRREWRFFNGALDIPPAIIVVDGSGEITMDGLDWLATQTVPLIRLRWDGQFASIVTTGGQAACADKVYWQERTRKDSAGRLRFARELIREKAQQTLVTMEEHLPRSLVWEHAHKNILARTNMLERRSPRSLQELLGLEGAIANEYFRAWSGITLKWKALKRRPIPDDWHAFHSRSSLREHLRVNRGATHPVNAMLNYSYGVLTAQTHIRLIAEGYDPTIGIMHDRERDRGRYPAFALDRMEPMRPVVDRAVLHLLGTVTFSGGDFSMQHDGVCRLNPELARRVAQLATAYIGAAKGSWQHTQDR